MDQESKWLLQVSVVSSAIAAAPSPIKMRVLRSPSARNLVGVSLQTSRMRFEKPVARKLIAVRKPIAAPEQAALRSKAPIGPSASLCAIAGAVGQRRYSGVNVEQISMSGTKPGTCFKTAREASTA